MFRQKVKELFCCSQNCRYSFQLYFGMYHSPAKSSLMWFCSYKSVWWWWQSLQSSTEIMESENHGILWGGKDLKAHPVPSLALSQNDPSPTQREVAQPRWKCSPRQGGLGGSGETKELHWIPDRKNIPPWDRRFPSFSTQSHCSWSGHVAGDKGTSEAPELR